MKTIQVKNLTTLTLTANTATQLGTLFGVSNVLVQADENNTGKIVVGDSSVAIANGTYLKAGDSMSIDNGHPDYVVDLAKHYVIGDTTNDKVRISYIQRNG